MAAENPTAIAGQSKSARKKHNKTDSTVAPTTVPSIPVDLKENSLPVDSDGNSEHPYVRELQKQIRNVNKKLAGSQKIDAIIAENKDVSLDDLVAQRKLNADQKAAALKKPQLLAQLAQLEEQVDHYRKFDLDYQQRLAKQKDDLATQHQKDLENVRNELRLEIVAASAIDLRKKLLIFSQFLRAAAAKRTIEEEADSEESRAFEGALLLVYGGDDKAVDAVVNLIEGSEEKVPSIEGLLLPVSYAQVKQASLDHAPFQSEEAWVDQVAAANHGEGAAAGSDPTLANAGLTELGTNQMNGAPNGSASAQTGHGDLAGNVAGERWDAGAAGAPTSAESGALEESYEIIPRPADEVENTTGAAPPSGSQPQNTKWSDEPPVYDEASAGNRAGENWDAKAAGDLTDGAWADVPANTTSSNWAEASTAAAATRTGDDGFHEVPGRQRGRGGFRGGRGDGEFRGRGGRRGNFRGRGGDGEFRGRGGFRGHRGDGESRGHRGDGEFRGRGRGRGPRGGADAGAAAPPAPPAPST